MFGDLPHIYLTFVHYIAVRCLQSCLALAACSSSDLAKLYCWYPAMANSAAPEAAPVVFKKTGGKKRGKRVARDDDSDDEADAVVKKQSKQLKGAIRVTSKPEDEKRLDEVYAGSGQIRDQGDMGATRNLEENTEYHRDQRAQREAFMNDTAREEGKYAGMKGYTDWKQVRTRLLFSL